MEASKKVYCTKNFIYKRRSLNQTFDHIEKGYTEITVTQQVEAIRL